MKTYIAKLISDRREIPMVCVSVPDDKEAKDVRTILRGLWVVDDGKEYVIIENSNDLVDVDCTQMVMPVFYIAGPMTGYPNLNFDAFDRCAQRLADLGLSYVNPADLDREVGIKPEDVDKMSAAAHDRLLRDCITRDVTAIAERCTHIIFLKGWERSKGCAVEMSLAKMLGLGILYEEDVTDDQLRALLVGKIRCT